MAQQKFRVSNPNGMWVRTEPVVIEATQKVLLPDGHLVEKLGDTDKPKWWHVSTTVDGVIVEGFSNKTLLVPDGVPLNVGEPITMSELLERTLNAISHIAPEAHSNYIQAISEGGPMFEEHGITTPLRMSHFMAQVMQETGGLKVLRESMNYSAPRMLEIFGVHHHSARVTAHEAQQLAHKEHELAERVYGLGNPTKRDEFDNTHPGDGFRYRGNGLLQTTGRKAHRLMGLPFGLDFENNPDLVTVPEHALKPALQEWSNNNLNQAADHNNILKITHAINGGENGLAERKAFFARLRPLLSNGS